MRTDDFCVCRRGRSSDEGVCAVCIIRDFATARAIRALDQSEESAPSRRLDFTGDSHLKCCILRPGPFRTWVIVRSNGANPRPISLISFLFMNDATFALIGFDQPACALPARQADPIRPLRVHVATTAA